MMKKVLAFAITVALVISTASGAYAANTVTDISGHRSEAIIKEAVALGVIKGYPDGTYRPDGLIKREEFFSVINNILTVKPSQTNITLNFIDVDPIEWYVPVVKSMVAAKITNGIGWGKVGIGLKITRQEAIKILATIIPTGSLSSSPVEILAKDKASIADWALPYYQIMFKKGYLNNTTGNLGPAVELTREEAAILLLKIKKGETIIAGDANEIVQNQTPAGGCITTSSHSAIDGAFLVGNGTEASPYQVSTQEQLNHMRQHTAQGEFFQMTADIRINKDFETAAESFMSASTDWSGGNFRPIGTKDNPFNGYFSGKGYKIEGLNIIGTVKSTEIINARELASYSGLFGCISDKGRVSNLGIYNSQISGKEYTGGIAGYSDGVLKNCGTGEGTVIKGGSFTGGITGYNSNLVENCFSKGSIAGSAVTGAIVGKNYGSVKKSYWLDKTYPEAVGVSGMNASVQEVKQLTKEEFAELNIEKLLK